MATVTTARSGSSRPYTSRRKRRNEKKPLLGTRAVVVILGLMVLALLGSLGVIAVQAATAPL